MENNYLLECDDFLSLKQKINEIINQNNYQNAEISNYDIESQDLNKVLEELDTYGLFSNKKVIIVSNIDCLNIENCKNEYKHLINYLKNYNKDNLLIITSKKLNNTKKITKDLKNLTNYQKISLNITTKIKEELENYKLENGVIKKLEDYCLNDITKIHNECEKLKNYRYKEKRISLNDIDAIIVKKQTDITSLTFEFIRYLAQKDKKKVLKIYKQLEDNNIEPIGLLGLLASQLRIIYQVKILYNKKIKIDEIANILKEKPYRIRKTIELINYYSEKELLNLMQKLSEIDLNMKTTDMNNQLMLELFIINW